MTDALALPARRQPALLQLQAGDVACSLHVHEDDRGTEGASYVLLLANKAAGEVSCRLYGIDRQRRTREFGLLVVAQRSLGRSSFATPEGASSCRRLFIEVIGNDMRLVGEAAIPRPRRSARVGWSIAVIALFLFGLATVGVAILAGRPVIRAFAVPTATTPSILRIPYTLSNNAVGRYSVTALDGRVIASDVLTKSEGEFVIPITKREAGTRVHVTLVASSPLGQVARAADIDVLAIPPPTVATPVARIVSLGAKREVDNGQTSVLASYLAVADGGRIRILDAHGNELGHAIFSHVGTTRIVLPGDPRGQALQAVLEVKRADSRATSIVALPVDVAPAPLASPPSRPIPNVSLPVNSKDGTNAAPGDPFVVADRVVAGRVFNVAIHRALPHMRIALQDEMGTVLDERAVPTGASSIAFVAPKSAIVETYYLSCSYERASGQESIIRSLRIFPL